MLTVAQHPETPALAAIDRRQHMPSPACDLAASGRSLAPSALPLGSGSNASQSAEYAVDRSAEASARTPFDESGCHAVPFIAAAAQPKQRLPRVIFARAPNMEHSVYIVPRDTIKGAPHGTDTPGLPTLCVKFRKNGSCPFGDECTMLHARGRGVRRCDAHVGPHVDPTWTPAGNALQQHQHHDAAEQCITVAFRGDAGRTELLQPAACLPTKGFEREQPAHCVHYLRKGLCLLGAECQFVHAASPSARAIEWAAGPRTVVSVVREPRRYPFQHTPYTAPSEVTIAQAASRRAAEAKVNAARRARLPASLPFAG